MTDKITNAIEDVVKGISKTVIKTGEVLGLDWDPSPGVIFITGGTGVVGHRVATRLLQLSYPTVRLGVHQSKTVEHMNELGAEIADFDWENDATYEKALKGVKSILCIPPYHEGWDKKFEMFLQACQKAQVKHVVKTSFYHSRIPGDTFRDVPLVRAHGRCDKMLITSGISYTIIYSTHYMSNPLVYQRKELEKQQKPVVFYGSTGDASINYVSPNDIAELVIRTLLERRAHHNKEYTLIGPSEGITDNEVACLLGKHLGKPVMYVDQPLHTFEDGIKMGGNPKFLVKDLVALEKIKTKFGTQELPLPSDKNEEFAKICGHEPETYDEYLLAKDMMSPLEIPQ